MIEFVLRYWCHWFHKKVFRPVCGKYICAECFREWPVLWEAKELDLAEARGPRTTLVESQDSPVLPRGVATGAAA
jgi:hypothetical protein